MEMSQCVKIARIRGFFWVIFALIRAKYRDVKGKSEYEFEFSPNTIEHKPEKILDSDNFNVVSVS